MPAFDKRIGDFETANTQVLGISTDSPFSHENWAKTVGISRYPLLSDVQRSVVKAYGVYWPDWNANVRATFILDKPGKVRFVERYCQGPIGSLSRAPASAIPTSGWRFKKIDARLGPTTSTTRYHQTWATAPSTPW